jgi:DNA-binding GntR family transcriptional regulator
MNAVRLEMLREIDRELDQAISSGDVGGYLTHNYRFHAAIHEGANAPIVAATVHRLWLRFGPSLRVVCGRAGTSNLPDKHADLLTAFENTEPLQAMRAMTEDVQQGVLQVRRALAD